MEYNYDTQGRLWKTRDGNGNEIVRERWLKNHLAPVPPAIPSWEGGVLPSNGCTRSSTPTFTKEFVYVDGRVSEEIYLLSAVGSDAP